MAPYTIGTFQYFLLYICPHPGMISDFSVAFRGEWTFFFTTTESFPVFVFVMVVSLYCVVSENTGKETVGILSSESRLTRSVSGTCDLAVSNTTSSNKIFSTIFIMLLLSWR